MLRYKVIGNNVISVDLLNDYQVIGIARWNTDAQNYTANFMIKMVTVDIWEAINHNRTENIAFEADFRSINRKMAAYITALTEEDFFPYYMERYRFMIRCVDLGVAFLEKQ